MINSKLCGWYACERWGQFLPLAEFGIDRSREGGKHLYCKVCCRQRKAAARARTVRVPKKMFGVWETQRALPFDAVMDAIRKGAHSRVEIGRSARISEDAVGDCLAELRFEQNLLQSRVVNGERMFFLKIAA